MLLLLRVSALIQFAWLLGCSAPRGNPPREERADGSPQKFGRPAVLARNEGEARMLQGRKPIWIKVDPKTLGSTTLTVGMEDIPPGDSIGVHKHLQEDEIVFVHRGEVDVTLGDTIVRAHAGATAFIPRGTWIGFRVEGADTATILSRSTCRDSRSACGSSRPRLAWPSPRLRLR